MHIKFIFTYDSDNRLVSAQGKTGDTVEYTQENGYNGFGQRILKKETKAGIVGTTNYFYDGTQVLYTTDATDAKTSFNIIGAEDNILTTARFEGDVTSFYTYTKDLRESTINLVGSDGTAAVSYEYDDFGQTTEYQKNADEPFYNEVCYSAGLYDDTTGLYYLNARYYDPADAIFLTQDTYRGDRSRTYTLNYYAYCAGNPISYTDPTGHWVWGVVGAAMGAYDGYKYAKKKKLKGVKKAAAIVGGAALGAINPFKVVKAATKVGKLAKNGVKAAKALMNGKKAGKAAKASKATKYKVVKPDKKLANNRYSKATNKAVKKASNNSSKNINDIFYDNLAKSATQNANSNKVVLGKLGEGDVSYVDVAEQNRATYFYMDDWDDVKNVLGYENMWNINRKFLEQQIDAGKTFYTSHDPNKATRSFKKEIDFLESKGIEFIPDGVLWRGIKKK